MKSLWILCFLCVCGLTCAALDRESFTFTKYDLEVRVEPEQQRLAVRGKITLRNDSQSSQKNVALQISSTLDWRSIQLAGQPVQFVSQPFTSDIDHTGALSEAVVTLPKEAAHGQSVELEIGYEGTIPLDFTRLTRIGVPEETAKHSDWDGIRKSGTAVRGIGNVAWYPVATDSVNLSDGNRAFDIIARWKEREQQSDFRVNLCNVSDKFVSLQRLTNGVPSPGAHAGSEDEPFSACTEFLFRPLGFTAPTFAIGDYEILNRSALNTFYLPGHRAAAENYALAAEVAAPLVNEWFGSAKATAQTVDLEDSQASPFESGGTLFTPLATTNSMSYDLTAVHQLTHAAYPSPRPWIYEGLAHFAQALGRETRDGRKSALDFMGSHRDTLAQSERAIASEHALNAASKQSLINTGNEELYRSKAMYVWWMLRDMLGDENLKKSLAAYHPEQDTAPAYMQTLLEAQSKRDLEWFFDDWVYRDRGLPDFRIASAHVRKLLGNGSIVTVTVENIGDAGAEVPVTIHLEGGDITKRLEVRAKSKASIRIEAQSEAREIFVNDGSVPEGDLRNNSYRMQDVPPRE
ncbi:MAG: hypothetical protein M3O09_02135 [Acidobacteriota bacterium]|nr:hypothetical protein [Acidobacteriota bacterium]